MSIPRTLKWQEERCVFSRVSALILQSKKSSRMYCLHLLMWDIVAWQIAPLKQVVLWLKARWKIDIPCCDLLVFGFPLSCWQGNYGVSGGAGGGADSSVGGGCRAGSHRILQQTAELGASLSPSEPSWVSSHTTVMALKNISLPSNWLSHWVMCIRCFLRSCFSR